MILSTSLHRGTLMAQAIRRSWLVSARRYAVSSALCAVFSAIYEHFSHGVWSAWMVMLFAFPLLLGAVPAVVGAIRGARVSRLARQLWACGVMTLAMGSCLRGVLEIYGTSSPIIGAYFPVGLAFLGFAAAICALQGSLLAGDSRTGGRRSSP